MEPGYKKDSRLLSPLRITLAYLIVASLWIIFSDQALVFFLPNLQNLSTFQTYKELFYVITTSLGLYFLIKIYSKQARAKEQELKKEQELTSKLFKRMPAMITSYDPKLNEFKVNGRFERKLGWLNEEIDNIDLMEKCFPEPDLKKEVIEFMSTPGIGWKEFEITTKSGETIPTSWTNIRLTDNTSIGIGLDMSDIKDSQTKIRESQKLLKKTFESLEDSVLLLEPDSWTIVNCNKATEKIFGYSQDELIGKSTLKLHVDQQHYEKFNKLGEEPLDKTGVFQKEFVMQKKDGTNFYSDHTVTLVHDEEENIDKVVSVIRDIHDQKEYENKLKKRQQRLLRSQRIGKIGDWELDLATQDIYWSPMMYEIYERDLKSGPPSFDEVQSNYYGEHNEKHNTSLQRAIDQGEPQDIDLSLQTDKGNKKYIRAIVIPVENDSDKVIKLLGIVQDITQRKESKKELQRRNRFIETTLENLPIGVAVNTIDNGKTTLMNDQFSEIYGWPKNTLKDVDSFFENVYQDADYRTQIKQQVMQYMGSGNPDRMGWKGVQITTQEGKKKYVDNKVIPLYEQNLMISTVIDVTEQKKLEQKLRESEEKYRHLFEDNPVPMWIFDPDSLEFVEVNEAAIDHYGYTEEEFLNMTLADIRPPEDIEAMKKDVKRHQDEKSYTKEWTHIKKDGTEIIVELSAAGVQYGENKYRLAMINDVTEQKRMQDKIIQSVIEGENRERKRIAHELHDGLGQYLVAASMNFESIKKDIQQLSQKREQQFRTGLSLLQNALSETRSIAYNLMPKAIADYGLITAVKNLVQNLQKSTNIIFEFNHNREELNLKDQAEINIYRIIQEVISNSVRHADCSTISIKLQVDQNSIKLVIEDDGKGTQLKEKHNKKGLGLRSIKTRVNNLQGTFDIKSQSGEGMKTSITIPRLQALLNNNDTYE